MFEDHNAASQVIETPLRKDTVAVWNLLLPSIKFKIKKTGENHSF